MTSEASLRAFGKRISALASGATMSRQEAYEAYRDIILDQQPELQQGAFLAAHFMRNPTTEELSGAWDALDRHDTAKVTAHGVAPVCDIVGTGSDPLKTLNCSSPAALIAAACGLTIAKKGARLVSGVSGASDIFEWLGVALEAPLEHAEAALNHAGICYLPGEAFLKSGWARLIRHMRFTTAFNILGPLTMPCAETSIAVIGAYAPQVSDQMVAILRETGMEVALSPYGMVEGMDTSLGMDEFSPCGPTRVVELRNGCIETYEVIPEDFGIAQVPFDDIRSLETAEVNASFILDILQGNREGAAADFFSMNAAAALYAAGMADTYARGFDMARQALASGRAMQKLDQLREFQGAGAEMAV